MKLKRRQFLKLVDTVFGSSMTSFGFNPDGDDHHDDWYCCRRFRSGTRYVAISANCHFRDGAPQCCVVLGDGTNDWPESDWNAIALWRLRGEGGNYPFQSEGELGDLLARMRNDLVTYASDFLTGDTTRFIAVRSVQNEGREPYKMHVPQSDGSLQVSIDAISQALKKRFSK